MGKRKILGDFEKGMIVGFCIMALAMILFIDYTDLHIPKFCAKHNKNEVSND